MAFTCLWSQLDETLKGNTHCMINKEVAGSVCQTVKVALQAPKLMSCLRSRGWTEILQTENGTTQLH